ncbi:hypothetical protein [Georgenia deserti]|uniref:DUF4352 domain-containing protein n=1 Tax=Georgenia deserti TaxID=2093781 RepID=A0ABW4L790_9MICO
MRRRLGSVAATAALVVAAWVVHELDATSWQLQAPFPVDGRPGEPLTGRNISAVVLADGAAPRTADILEIDGTQVDEVRTSGVFLLIPVAAATVIEPERLQSVELEVDGRRYSRLANRLDYDDPWGAPLEPGIRTRAEVVFEVPPEVLRQAGSGRLELGTAADVSLDSVLRVHVGLGDLEHAERVAPAEPVREAAP